MLNRESDIVLEIVPNSTQLRKQLQGRYWCFRILYICLIRLSTSASYRINSSKYLLLLTYLPLFAVIIARCVIHVLLLEANSEMVPTHEGLLVCFDICLSGIWLMYFIAIFIKKLRTHYLQNEWKRIGALILFHVTYYGFFLWWIYKRESKGWESWSFPLFFLTIAYGFLAEKSPNSYLIGAVVIIVIGLLEALIRITTCDFYNPFSRSGKYFIEKRVPAVYYDEDKCDSKECTICLNKYIKNEKLCGLTCHPSHIFHTRCIKQWLKINHVCPCCRTPVN